MLVKKIENKLNVIKKLLESRKIQDARNELRQIDIRLLTDNQSAYHNLLLAEALLWLGDISAGDLLEQSLGYYRSSPDDRKFAWAKYLYGWYLTSTGNYLEAREVLMESYLYFKRFEDPKEISLVLSRLSYVLYQTGAVDDAIRNLQQCIEINRKLNRSDNVQTFTRNIAVVQFRVGELKNALKNLEYLKQEIDSASDSDRYQFYLTYAITLALLGNVKSALEIIDQTKELSPDFKRERAIYFEYLGWIHILSGEYKKAVTALGKGITISMKLAPESALISQTKRLLAEAYLKLGSDDMAEEVAGDALYVARKINERNEIAACYRIFAVIEKNRGDYLKARKFFKDAIEIFQLTWSALDPINVSPGRRCPVTR